MDIQIDEPLRATSMAPEGVLERWRFSDRGVITYGQAIAELRIEGCPHKIIAPTSGRLPRMVADNDLTKPGTLIARVTA